MPRRFPPLCTGNCIASINVTGLISRLGRREATRRKSGNLACCNGSDHMSSGKEQVASVRNYLLQLSSLDALDLPTEIEGVFCLATKRHKKHITVSVERESNFMKRVIVSMVIAFAIAGAVQGQTVAAISGSIKDPQGANVPGATVRLYGRDRSFSLVTVTDAGGAYSFKNLAPGE